MDGSELFAFDLAFDKSRPPFLSNLGIGNN